MQGANPCQHLNEADYRVNGQDPLGLVVSAFCLCYNIYISIQDGEDMPLKNIRFDLDDPVDKELYDWLKTRPHGDFSLKTKEFWLEQMKNSEKEESALYSIIVREKDGESRKWKCDDSIKVPLKEIMEFIKSKSESKFVTVKVFHSVNGYSELTITEELLSDLPYMNDDLLIKKLKKVLWLEQMMKKEKENENGCSE